MEPGFLGLAHFTVGCLSIVSGFIAFSTKKGQRLHRSTGAVFLVSMALLTASGLWMSLVREILFTVFLSAIAFHLFSTGWAAAGSNKKMSRLVTKTSPILSGSIAVGAVYAGTLAAKAPDGVLNELQPDVFYTLATTSLLIFVLDSSFVLDIRPSEQRRITRHVWRMGFAFFLATGIFFFGNNHVLPEVLRTPILLSAPVILVVLWTLYFVFRTQFAKRVDT